MFNWTIGRASDLITKYYIRYYYMKKPFIDFEDAMNGIETYEFGPSNNPSAAKKGSALNNSDRPDDDDAHA